MRKPLDLKWRVQRAFPNKNNPTHVIMVAYVDARDVMDTLDDVVGAENWQEKYYECKGKQFCEIGIKVNGEWVWKGDNGTQSQTEKEKGETSDSFKRAAVHWGINRTAYQVGEVKLPCRVYGDKPYPADEAGKFLKGKELFDTCDRIGKVEVLEVEFDNAFDKLKESLNDTQVSQERERIKQHIVESEDIETLEMVDHLYADHGLSTEYVEKLKVLLNGKENTIQE